MDAPIRFDDGAAYEDFMGAWSRQVGDAFLEWLAPAPGLHWVDVGCGNGAFTERLLDRAAAGEVDGVDPSQGQLSFARTRLAGRPARFTQGDAQALPFADASVDAAVMALVIFFVPEPARGVAEMARVVRPGGLVSAYSWDFAGGGFPYAALGEEMEAIGSPMAWPPHREAARVEVAREMWAAAGLVDVETREFTVERSFDDFDAWWHTARNGPPVTAIARLAPEQLALLVDRLRGRLHSGAGGRITYPARATAIRGRQP